MESGGGLWGLLASLCACGVVTKLPSGLELLDRGRSLDQRIGTERARQLEGKTQVGSHPTVPRPQEWEAETHASGTPRTVLGSGDFCPHLTNEDTDSDLPKVTEPVSG